MGVCILWLMLLVSRIREPQNADHSLGNLSNDEFEKLIYLLSNTQLNSGGSNMNKPLVNHTIALNAAQHGVIGKFSHPFSKLWVLDSRATDHITCSTSYCEYFCSITKLTDHSCHTQRHNQIKSVSYSAGCSLCSEFYF